MPSHQRIIMITCLITLLAGSSAVADPVVWEGNDHCYEAILTGGGLTWWECRDLAETYGGHLVTIESAEENEFVYSLVRDIPEFWFVDGAGNTEGPYLGGFQSEGATEPNGSWEWVTAEPWAYSNWHYGEPNNSGGNEDELVFFVWGDHTQTPPYGSSKWNDVGGESTQIQGFIMEGICGLPEEGATWGAIKTMFR